MLQHQLFHNTSQLKPPEQCEDVYQKTKMHFHYTVSNAFGSMEDDICIQLCMERLFFTYLDMEFAPCC